MHDTFQEIIQFIRKTYKKPSEFIALHEPVFAGNEKKYLEECIDSTFVSSVGKFVDQFEIEMAKYTGAAKAVVCVNGTNAIHLALKLVRVEPGMEVITQPLTFVATANAITYCGANPVFIDVDKETLGLSPDALIRFLETHSEQKNDGCFNKNTSKKIAACLPMHTFGHPCRIDEIAEICKKFNIELVEDAAESMGSFFRNKHTGITGKIGIISFNGNKIITSGGGGMLLFNDEELAQKAKHLSTQAKVPHAWEFIHDDIGYNYRMPNINAALGLAQLEQIDRFVEIKRALANRYKEFFRNTKIKFINEPKNAKSNFWLNAIQFDNIGERDKFLEYSNKNKVMTRPAWRLMNNLPMFKNCQTDDLNNAKVLSETVVNIPSSVVL